MQDIDHEPIDITKFKPKQDPANELAGLMQKMQIAVVGRENGKDSDFEDVSDEDEDDGNL